ncbi:hypothetical protein ACEQPO_16140 [Bacillus sp. SL00103]
MRRLLEVYKTSDHIVFQTQFDYKTKEGKGWTWADKILFRPMIGFMTAFSFGALKTWLGKGNASPVITRENTCSLRDLFAVCHRLAMPIDHSFFTFGF